MCFKILPFTLRAFENLEDHYCITAKATKPKNNHCISALKVDIYVLLCIGYIDQALMSRDTARDWFPMIDEEESREERVSTRNRHFRTISM